MADLESIEELEQAVVADVPQELEGKDLSEVISQYKALNQAFSRQGNDMGELRRLTDELIKPKEPPKEIDFYDDPKAFVEQIISQHVAPLKQTVDSTTHRDVLARLDKEHSGWRDTVDSPEFVAWKNASPIRTELYQRNQGAVDYAAAKDLLENWELSQGNRQETAEAKRQQDLNAVKTETGSSSERPSKKVFRRADVIRLKIEDPQKYKAMSSELMDAYREGRVR